MWANLKKKAALVKQGKQMTSDFIGCLCQKCKIKVLMRAKRSGTDGAVMLAKSGRMTKLLCPVCKERMAEQVTKHQEALERFEQR